jgi:hypothetical protein
VLHGVHTAEVSGRSLGGQMEEAEAHLVACTEATEPTRAAVNRSGIGKAFAEGEGIGKASAEGEGIGKASAEGEGIAAAAADGNSWLTTEAVEARMQMA